jgi:hypothetical protein
MNTALPVILAILGVAAFIALVVGFARRGAAKRRAALEAVAQQAGWSFSGDTVKPESLGVGPLPLFAQGRAQKASNIMRLSGGPPAIAAFDYQYTVGVGQHQRTVVQTVAHVRSPRLSLPPFVLSPENIFHKIGGALGYHDIDFDSSPEFSKTYLLRSKLAEDRVRDVFTPPVRAYFEQRAPITVEADGTDVLIYRQGRRLKPEELLTFVEDAQEIARQIGG